MKYKGVATEKGKFQLTTGTNSTSDLKTSGIHSTDSGGGGGSPVSNTRRRYSTVAPSSSGRTSPSVGSHSSFNFRGVGEEDIFRATEAEATSVVNHLVAESRQSQQGSTPTYEPQPDILQVQDTFEMEQYQSPPAGSGGAVQQGAPTATSSPETSVGSSGTSGNGNGREQPRLVVIRQPPTHIISNEWFEMEIGFEFPPGNTPQSSEVGTIEFVPYLHNHDPPEMGPSAEPVSLGARLDIGGQGIIQVSLRPSSPKKPASQRRVHVPDNAKDPSRSSTKVLLKVDTKIRQDRPSLYSIKFVAKRGQNLPANARSLQSQTIITRPITIVSARLKVDPIDWEPTWYKDEGGREKCMQVRVTLSDKNGDPVGGRKIPLKFTLLYDNGQSLRVLNQDILKVFGSGRQYMNPNASPVVISFRIEDVSKNHQGMAFKLEIAPDSPRTASDIAPGISPPVSIRSKRNKRQRSSGSSFAAARTGSAGSESFRDTHASTMASSAASVVGVPAAVPQHQQYQAPTMVGVSDIQALRAAMRGVIRWTEEVVNGLYPLKWQVIGYAQFPDGTVDYNRPYHSSEFICHGCVSVGQFLQTLFSREFLFLCSTKCPIQMNASSGFYPCIQTRRGRIFAHSSKPWKTQLLSRRVKAHLILVQGLHLLRVRLVLQVPLPMQPPALLQLSLVPRPHKRRWQCSHTRHIMRNNPAKPFIRPLRTTFHSGSIINKPPLRIHLHHIRSNMEVRR